MFLSQGVEGLEAVTIIDVLGWSNVRDNLTPVYLKTCAFHDTVRGKFGADFTPTYNIKKEEPDNALMKQIDSLRCTLLCRDDINYDDCEQEIFSKDVHLNLQNERHLKKVAIVGCPKQQEEFTRF